MNTPPVLRAHSQLNSAVRTPPIWRYPVGDGANLTRGLVIARTLSPNPPALAAAARSAGIVPECVVEVHEARLLADLSSNPRVHRRRAADLDRTRTIVEARRSDVTTRASNPMNRP